MAVDKMNAGRKRSSNDMLAGADHALLAKEEAVKTEQQKEANKRAKKYKRGPNAAIKGISDKKLKGQLRTSEKLFSEAAQAAAKVETWLLPSEAGYLEAEGVERTQNFAQDAIVQELDLGSARKAFDLRLPDLGPYAIDYTASGRYLLLGGRKGHLAMMDWGRAQLITEVQVKETTRDVKFLHNELFFAAAQKKYVYIYDKRGIEVHCLKEHTGVLRLEFLPHHFLLASIGKQGILRYQDTSTGAIVAQHKTKLGRCGVMRQNPYNSVLCLGHSNGTVAMWSPNMSTPLVSMFCHRGPVTALAVDIEGRKLVTAGLDSYVKVWDLRTFKPLHSYFAKTPPRWLDISQRGLLAVGQNDSVQIWRDGLDRKAHTPYMSHRLFNHAAVEDCSFCPFDDVLAVGHSLGISSLVVPGSGNPNFDSYVANPYQTKKQRQEAEVHQLLDKIQPDMITLDPQQIGGIRKAPREVQKAAAEAAAAANRAVALARGKASALKDKAKGKSKPSKKHRKKQNNIIEVKKTQIIADISQKEKEKRKLEASSAQASAGSQPLDALARFRKT